MASIAAALARIKQDPLGAIDRAVTERLCCELGYDDWRRRQLDPTITLALFVQQVLHGNTPCSEVRHIAGATRSPPRHSQARARLPLAVYQAMLTHAIDAALPLTRRRDHLWHGHRVFHVDGSTFSMPATRRSCSRRSASPACRPPVAVFPWRTCWCSSTRRLDCSWTPGPRRCAPAR